MTEKFDDLPIDEDTNILFRLESTLDTYDVVY